MSCHQLELLQLYNPTGWSHLNGNVTAITTKLRVVGTGSHLVVLTLWRSRATPCAIVWLVAAPAPAGGGGQGGLPFTRGLAPLNAFGVSNSTLAVCPLKLSLPSPPELLDWRRRWLVGDDSRVGLQEICGGSCQSTSFAGWLTGRRRHSSNTTSTTLTLMLTNLSAARLSIQPPVGHQQPQQQQTGMEWRRVETFPMTLELLPQAPNGNAAREDSREPESSPRRPDVVKFTIHVDNDV